MKDRFRMKLQLLWQALRCKNCILISLDNDEMDYKFSGNSLLHAQLFFNIKSFVSDWLERWHRLNDFTIDWDD